MKIPSEITFETKETNWVWPVCMIVFLCAQWEIITANFPSTYTSRHAWESSTSSYQWTDLVGIMSIAHIFHWAICAMHPPLQNPKYASDINMPSQTKWRNVDWKTSTFFIQRLQTFFIFLSRFLRFLMFFLFFFSWKVFLHLCAKVSKNKSCCWYRRVNQWVTIQEALYFTP